MEGEFDYVREQFEELLRRMNVKLLADSPES